MKKLFTSGPERAGVAGLVLTGFCLMLGLAACSKEKAVASAKEEVAEAKQEAREEVAEATHELNVATQEARADWLENWATFKRETDERMTAIDRRISELRLEVARVDVRYQDEYNKRIDDVERMNNELRARVSDYKDEGDVKWEAFKAEVARDLDALDTAVKNIVVDNG